MKGLLELLGCVRFFFESPIQRSQRRSCDLAYVLCPRIREVKREQSKACQVNYREVHEQHYLCLPVPLQTLMDTISTEMSFGVDKGKRKGITASVGLFSSHGEMVPIAARRRASAAVFKQCDSGFNVNQ